MSLISTNGTVQLTPSVPSRKSCTESRQHGPTTQDTRYSLSVTTDLIVTLDGPSGTGKSTVSRLLARRLGIPHLDTGAFYRAATLAALAAGGDLSDTEDVSRIVN